MENDLVSRTLAAFGRFRSSDRRNEGFFLDSRRFKDFVKSKSGLLPRIMKLITNSKRPGSGATIIYSIYIYIPLYNKSI